jgi:DNA integrity scanning protein DisA with diadenylate cyclase activity
MEPLLRGREGRAWVVCSSRAHEVEAIARSGRHLRWNKSHWHFVDRSFLLDFLTSHGIAEVIAEAIVKVAFALSEMHVGTVLLIPESDDSLPRVAGHIDSSPLALALVMSLAGRKLPDLLADNSIIGVLGSDGLTIIRRDGVIASAGQIIDLQAERPSDSSGGGRTQAALAASRHGVVIKVSQDGPVSLFSGGQEVLKYNVLTIAKTS